MLLVLGTGEGKITMRILQRLGIGIAAAMVTGVVLGLAARVMMRLVAVAAGHEGAPFTLGGTLGIVAAFVIVAVPGAVVASFVSRRGRSLPLVLGALLLCVPATAIAGEDLGVIGSLSTAQWVGVAATTTGVYATILALPVLTLRLLGARRATEVAGVRAG
jgi:hypothetical protein